MWKRYNLIIMTELFRVPIFKFGSKVLLHICVVYFSLTEWFNFDFPAFDLKLLTFIINRFSRNVSGIYSISISICREIRNVERVSTFDTWITGFYLVSRALGVNFKFLAKLDWNSKCVTTYISESVHESESNSAVNHRRLKSQQCHAR